MSGITKFYNGSHIEGETAGADTQFRGGVGDQIRVQNPKLAHIELRVEREILTHHFSDDLQS